jgi:23S rRNA (adenine2503-C2)-methyltransferase
LTVAADQPLPRALELREVGSLGRIHLLQLRDDPAFRVECVFSRDPALPLEKKMVLVVSSQFGCPIRCTTCDAAQAYRGNLTAAEILSQIDWLLAHDAGPVAPRCRKLKIQFARMGEPSLNDAVLDVIASLPARLGLPGLMPCLATMAPRGREGWFERLLDIRRRVYPEGNFQLQFSLQSTSPRQRDALIPAEKWGLSAISAYAGRFGRPPGRKVTLNFAMARDVEIDPAVLASLFDPATCMVKLTPLNLTARATAQGLRSAFDDASEPDVAALADAIRKAGFDCVVSVGLAVEGRSASSCGQLAWT